MASYITFFFLFFSLSSLLIQTQSSFDICLPSFCDDDIYTPVKFPFNLKNHQNQSCGYNTSFELSCNTQNETILNLPNLGGISGDIIVQFIDYGRQILLLGDLNSCFVSRLLSSTYNHDFSPFRALFAKNFTFLNCSGDEVATAAELEPYYEPVRCLGGANHTVLQVEEGRHNRSWSSCVEIKTVAAPLVRWSSDVHPDEEYDGILLGWDVPDCSGCAALGGECGFNKSGSDTKIGCIVFNPPSTGLPRTAKYGIIIGIGIPGFLCLIGLGCFICGKINYYVQCRRRQHNAESAVFSFPIRLQPFEVEMGLDRPTIESYPKTKLGQSGRLPKTDDTTCSICLTDYEPEETLRTIPECGHYFHIECIDEWLKMRGTCPLCRNSPEGSIFTATFSSPTSSSPLSVSSASIEHSGRR